MKRTKIVGLCLVAVCAMLAVTATSAFATPSPEFGQCKAKAGGKFENSSCTKASVPGKEKFEWTPGPGAKPNFTSKIKELTSATLETVSGTKITCKAETSTGKVASSKEVNGVIAKFNECKTGAVPCENAGPEEIVTKELSGVIGVEKISIVEGKEVPAKNKVAEELHGPGGGNLAEFSCAGIPIVVIGSVLHPVAADKMVLTSTEKFAASKGEQKPDKFAGGPADEHILESNKAGGAFEEAGQTITAIVTFEEKIEANPVA